MFNQFRSTQNTVGGRRPRPTFKVRQQLEQAVARELKSSANVLADIEFNIRELIDHRVNIAQVSQVYREWTDKLEEFESVEQEYRRYLENADLQVHEQLLGQQREIFSDLQDHISEYLSHACDSAPLVSTHAVFKPDSHRMEEELRQISAGLERARLSQPSSEYNYDEDRSFDARTISDAFKQPARRSSPGSIREPDLARGNAFQHPLRSMGVNPPRLTEPQQPAIDPTLGTLQKLAELIDNRRDKLPQLEPEMFSGDLLQYPLWIRSFEMLIERNTSSVSERLFYLGKYTQGEARECIGGFLCLFSEDAYRRAKAVLQARYGDKVQVAQAYRQKLGTWKSIKKGDGLALRKFADFLWQCSAAMESLRNLKSLDSAEEMCRLVAILPTHLTERWDRVVDRHYYARVSDPRYSMEADEGEYPPFLELCKFLSQEARILNGPSRMLRGGVESDGSANSNQHGKQRKLQAFATTATPAGKSKKKPPACYFCQEPHVVSKCAAFLKKSSEEKKSFATEQKLCFGCLVKSHGYAECRVKKPWLLKEGLEDKPKEVTVFKTSVKEEEDGYYGMAVMVEVSHSDDPDKVFKTCALLDTQADGCFVSEALAESLTLKQKPVQLELTTMGLNSL